MSRRRFIPLIRETWLVAKRMGLCHNLRRLLTELVRRNAFDWESQLLRGERCAVLFFQPRLPLLTCEVESVPEPHEWVEGLKLMRVNLRRRQYSLSNYEWLWLTK